MVYWFAFKDFGSTFFGNANEQVLLKIQAAYILEQQCTPMVDK